MSPIEKALELVGGVAGLARRLPSKPSVQRVSNWRERGVPSDECPGVERAVSAAVTCEDLRPDICWSRIPDPNWPHPKGRPVIDHARPDAPLGQSSVADAT